MAEDGISARHRLEGGKGVASTSLGRRKQSTDLDQCTVQYLAIFRSPDFGGPEGHPKTWVEIGLQRGT